MATVSTQANGLRMIFARKSNGKRHPIRIGKVSLDHAQQFASYVSNLEVAKQMGTLPDRATIAWLATLSPTLHERIANTGLVEHRGDAIVRGSTGQHAPGTLGLLLERFPESLSVQQQSLVAIGQTIRNLLGYFGADRSVTSITAGDADEFRQWLLKRGRKRGRDGTKPKPLAHATVSRRCRAARQIFEFAVRKRWCLDNPFDHMSGWHETNPDRDCYIPADQVARILADEPDLEFRTLVALCRFAGMRPSDALSVEWSAIDWDRSYAHLVAPKTRRSRSGGHRDVPLFPEVRELLDQLFAAAPDGAVHVFGHYRETSHANISDRLRRACIRVGELPWVKPWINMRASCENDWIDAGYSIFQVARWMGHAPDVALRHYNRVGKGDRGPRCFDAAFDPLAAGLANTGGAGEGARNRKSKS
jgi:integrase